jgi:hypothetical protein
MPDTGQMHGRACSGIISILDIQETLVPTLIPQATIMGIRGTVNETWTVNLYFQLLQYQITQMAFSHQAVAASHDGLLVQPR